jgi:hypothetical protein
LLQAAVASRIERHQHTHTAAVAVLVAVTVLVAVLVAVVALAAARLHCYVPLIPAKKVVRRKVVLASPGVVLASTGVGLVTRRLGTWTTSTGGKDRAPCWAGRIGRD